MKSISTLVLGLLALGIVHAQKKLTAPKSKTNIESVDKFVDAAFNIYNTTFDFYYGTTIESEATDLEKDTEIEEEDIDGEVLETETMEDAEQKDEFKLMEENIGQLMASVPDILEEIEHHSVSRQLKATLNVNKAIKALKQSGKLVKMTFTGNQ